MNKWYKDPQFWTGMGIIAFALIIIQMLNGCAAPKKIMKNCRRVDSVFSECEEAKVKTSTLACLDHEYYGPAYIDYSGAEMDWILDIEPKMSPYWQNTEEDDKSDVIPEEYNA